MKTIIQYEAEVLPGLETFAADELRAKLGNRARISNAGKGTLSIEYDNALEIDATGELRTVNSIFRVLTFDVPRPKGLLGHQVFTSLTMAAKSIVSGNQTYRTLSLDAAGADSAVMQRIKNELASVLRLSPADDKGDFHVRIRPARDKQGWQVLLRLTPRPLATRAWRQHNYQGALSGAVASVMASLTSPRPDDRIINLMCGSGTLMVERAALGAYRQLVGMDNDPQVLGLAGDHLRLSDTEHAALVCADARGLPYPANAFNVVLADLPFGQLVGSHRENVSLYPAVIAEAGRVSTSNASFGLITHEKRLIGDVLRFQSVWSIVRTVPVNLNGLHPEILLLKKQG